MSSFAIFQHPTKKDYIAYKGDYMMGRLLPGFWQFSKGMYAKSLIGFLGIVLALPFFNLMMNQFNNVSTGIIIVSSILGLISVFIFTSLGESHANDFLNHIKKQGYEKKSKKDVIAETEDEAISKYTASLWDFSSYEIW